MPANLSGRIEEFDILKGIGIIIVVLFHTIFFNFELYPGGMKNFLYFLGPIGTPVVVIFFFVSGFLGYRSYTKDQNPKAFIFKKMKTFLPPYFLWSTIYLLLQVFFSTYMGNDYRITAFSIFESYAFATAYLPFYFLFVLLILYILTPYLYKVKRFKSLLTASFFTGLIFTSLYYIPQYFGKLPVDSIITYRNPLVWAFFYIWGMNVAKDNKFFWIKKPPTWIFISLLISYAGSSAMILTVPKLIKDYESYIALSPAQYLFYFFSIPIFLWIAYRIKNYRFSRILSEFGKNSLAIYINHILVIGLILALFLPFIPTVTSQANIYTQFLVGMLACFGAYALSELIRSISKKAYEIVF